MAPFAKQRSTIKNKPQDIRPCGLSMPAGSLTVLRLRLTVSGNTDKMEEKRRLIEMNDSQKSGQTEEILQYYSQMDNKSDQDNIVQMLRELQEVNGCITSELKRRAAEAAGVSPSVIQVLVKIYPSLKEAAYQHEIVVCTGKACTDKGSQELLKTLNRELKTQKNGISKDGKVCIKTRPCLKQCRTAPNILIDGKLYSNMTAKDVLKLVK